MATPSTTTPEEVQTRTQTAAYADAIAACFDTNSQITGDAIDYYGTRISGKVRDRWESSIASNNNKLGLVTTDRQSGFDRQLAVVPYKGAVLNLSSAFWFDATSHIIGNHLLEIPHPNLSIVKKCEPFPIEFVVRSYMTGSTDTSIWKNYSVGGVRNYCGHFLPEGMIKNQKLENNLLTPTTKEADHDRPISAADIIKEKWMTQEDWDVCAKAAKAIFELGQTIAAKHGMILVDTKYEFGKDVETGEILLIDEVHTPDSSRWWLAANYEQNMKEGKEPDNISKEFLRLWYREHCNPYEDAEIPDAPRDLVLELARRYICLYEIITGKEFDFQSGGEAEISAVLKTHLG
jgi:phosphoribosylaminoimidazole-succinocarboxamide synthase